MSPAYPKPKVTWLIKSTGEEILDTMVESKSVEANSLLRSELETGVNSRQKSRKISKKLVQVTSVVTLHLDESKYADGEVIVCQVEQKGQKMDTQGQTNSGSAGFSHITQVKLELVTVPRVYKFELESGNRGQLLQGDLLRFRCEAHSTPIVQKYRLFVGKRVIAESDNGKFFDIPAIKEFNKEKLSCQAMTDEAGAGAKFELEKSLNVKCKYKFE